MANEWVEDLQRLVEKRLETHPPHAVYLEVLKATNEMLTKREQNRDSKQQGEGVSVATTFKWEER